MHESVLARKLLEMALQEAPEGRITRIEARISETETLVGDSVAFHFAALAKQTRAEAAELGLDCVHVAARCDACGATYLPEHHLLLCPECGATEASLQEDCGVEVKRITVQE